MPDFRSAVFFSEPPLSMRSCAPLARLVASFSEVLPCLIIRLLFHLLSANALFSSFACSWIVARCRALPHWFSHFSRFIFLMMKLANVSPLVGLFLGLLLWRRRTFFLRSGRLSVSAFCLASLVDLRSV
jgi:hypothetical protein